MGQLMSTIALIPDQHAEKYEWIMNHCPRAFSERHIERVISPKDFSVINGCRFSLNGDELTLYTLKWIS
jgi:hypothetical protein